MEPFSASSSIFITIFGIFILPLYFVTRLIVVIKQPGHAKNPVPEAGGSWPILGHLPLLRGPKPSHLVLADMSDMHGPIFKIRLGMKSAVVVNTSQVAREVLTTHDTKFATRPKSVASEVLGYNNAMLALAPYGPFWRCIRKISTLELLSDNRIELLRHVRESEVIASVRGLYEKYTLKFNDHAATGDPSRAVLVDMKRWFEDITMNVTFRMIVGKHSRDWDKRARKALREFFDLMGRFIISDGIPYLRWLDIGGHEKAMRRTFEELDGVVQGWLDEHKARRELNEEIGDFMDVLLSNLKGNDIEPYDADTVNKATCLVLLLASSDTTIISMLWAVSLLLNNRRAIRKAQQELDAHVGKDRRLMESDLKHLPYLQAVIKETLRLYPPGALALPHEAIDDCHVSGYFIPKGTRLIINVHKIQRDPSFWLDPDEFRPERFLTTHKNLDVRGQNFKLMPFGSGRRMCPGITLAQKITGLALGSFLHAFEVLGDAPVDMEEVCGLTNLKASPVEVLVAPRLPEHIYQ